MTKEEVVAILGVLRTAYPRFYTGMTNEEIRATVDLWHELLASEDTAKVSVAVKNMITELKYPPTIADIKEEIYKLFHKENTTSADLWNAIMNAIRNSAYNSAEEFEKLPEQCKKFVGNAKQLKDWAIDTNFSDSVVRGQFLKQLEVIQKRDEEEKMAIPEVKALLNNTKLLN